MGGPVATRKQRKKKAKIEAAAATGPRSSRGRRAPRRDRPAPVAAIEAQHARLSQRLASRKDRFSQLLSKAIKDEQAGQHLITRSGLTEPEQQEMHALAPQAHEEFRSELTAVIARLRQLLADGDPLYTVGFVQAMNLMTPWGEYYEPTHEGRETTVELIASLLASQPFNGNRAPMPDERMAHVHEETERITDLLTLFNMTTPPGDDTAAAELRFLGAMHWMGIRGSSFGNHGKELAQAVFRPFDQWMRQTYGFTIDDAIAVAEAFEGLWIHSVNTLLGRGAEFANAVAEYLEDESRLSSEVRERLAAPDARVNAMGRAAIDVFQDGVRDATSFTLDQLLAAAPSLDHDRAAAVLAELSVAVGSLDGEAYSGLFDRSPLVERPFLRLDDRFALPVPGMLLRDLFSVLDRRLIEGRPGYSKRRAKTLDKLAVEWIAKMLPGSSALTNLHYREDELDGLVVFEDVALVIEGKGSAISYQAHRGDVKRLVREIKRSVEEALEQGVRARDFILGPDEAVFRDDRGVEMLRLAPGAIREVHIVNPTIHELVGLGPQLARFRSQGLFPTGELPWSVYVNDLRVIAETCNTSAVFLHYLIWRSRLPLGEQVIVGDELDLWGAYLLAARFPPLEKNGKHHLGNSTTDFDAYYDGLMGRGPKRKPPQKFLPLSAGAIVERLARERPDGWRKAAGVILDLSLVELGFVTSNAAKELGDEATRAGAFIEVEFGRGILIGVPRGIDRTLAVEHARKTRSDASFFVYVSGGGKRGEIVWASYGSSFSQELSDFEKAYTAALPSVFPSSG